MTEPHTILRVGRWKLAFENWWPGVTFAGITLLHIGPLVWHPWTGWVMVAVRVLNFGAYIERVEQP